MRAFLSLVSREIHERKALLAAAAVASLLPLLAPLLPSTGSNPASDIREAMLHVMLVCLIPLFAILLGSSFIGRDLSEGRFSFYFTQPLSGPAIWFGKLAAVVLLVWATEIIMIVPTALLSQDPAHFLAPADRMGPFDLRWLAAIVLSIGPPALILLSHTFGVIWRGRSSWLVVDVLGFLGFVGLAWMAVRPFQHLMVPAITAAILLSLSACALVGMVLAGSVQVSSGRVDLKRGHRAMSLFLWFALLTSATAIEGYSLWVRSANPKDLRTADEISVGSGSWISVSGKSRGRFDYRPRFLINVEDGRWLRIDPNIRWFSRNVTFSDDSRVAAWERRPNGADWEIMSAELDALQPVPRFSGITAKPYVRRRIRLDADGTRLGLIEGRTVSIYDFASGDQLTAARVHEDFRPVFVEFNSEGFLQIMACKNDEDGTRDSTWGSYLVDVESGSMSDRVEASSPWEHRIVSPGEMGLRKIAREPLDDKGRIVIVDDSTGENIADLGEWPGWSDIDVRFGNRIVVVRDWKQHHLEVYDLDGRLERKIDMGDGVNWITLGSDLEPGRIVVGVREAVSSDRETYRFRTAIVDLDSGEVEIVLDGFVPMLANWGVQASPGAWKAGSVASRLVVGEDRSLHLWDAESFSVRHVIPFVD